MSLPTQSEERMDEERKEEGEDVTIKLRQSPILTQILGSLDIRKNSIESLAAGHTSLLDSVDSLTQEQQTVTNNDQRAQMDKKSQTR